MTFDEWFGEQKPPYHIPTQWERAIWEAAQEALRKELSRSYDFLDEALNSGDGSYRP